MSKGTRKAPLERAGNFKVKTIKKGIDGNMYIVKSITKKK